MQTKLTLRLDRKLIDGAKRYAETHGTSVSKLVADYFQALLPARTEPPSDTPDAWQADLAPLTRRFVARTPRHTLTEEDYRQYLEEKHR